MLDFGGNEAILQAQREKMKEQDRLLDELERSAALQGEMANDVNNELSVHNRLLEEMQDHTGRVQRTVSREGRRAERAGEATSHCTYYLVITALIVIIGVLLSLP
mmetsp:Transcript_46944/g.118303  ORF Transcript_46944/g.118303 Transcript_46944/m.118303 type:complete len:105 (+) Transcript_46944:189-503(+)